MSADYSNSAQVFCQCKDQNGQPVEATCRASAKYNGREFWGCPGFPNEHCKFFRWKDSGLPGSTNGYPGAKTLQKNTPPASSYGKRTYDQTGPPSSSSNRPHFSNGLPVSQNFQADGDDHANDTQEMPSEKKGRTENGAQYRKGADSQADQISSQPDTGRGNGHQKPTNLISLGALDKFGIKHEMPVDIERAFDSITDSLLYLHDKLLQALATSQNK